MKIDTALMETETEQGDFEIQSAELHVRLDGLVPIMFSRFVNMNTKAAPEDMVYRNADNELVLPSENIMSFLGAQNKSCAAVFKGRARAAYCTNMLSCVQVRPDEIPFLRDGKPIVFCGFPENSERDPIAKVHIEHHTARVKKGATPVPDEKHRPVLELPWGLEFDLTIVHVQEENGDVLITPKLIATWFERGGLLIGLGTYRPRYGRFRTMVTQK